MFARDVDAQTARDYVSAALRRQGETSVPPDVAAALVNLALHGSPRHRVPRAQRSLVLPVLDDMVRMGFPAESDPAELIRAAEKRLDRLRRKTGRPRWKSLVHVRATQGDGDTPADAEPKSVVGHTLKARASYDRERLRALPSERSDIAIVAMVDAAFDATVKERFRRGRNGGYGCRPRGQGCRFGARAAAE
jgi:hypothetical protein